MSTLKYFFLETYFYYFYLRCFFNPHTYTNTVTAEAAENDHFHNQYDCVSPDTRAQTHTASHLARDGRPHFERVVVRAADNQVTAELETCNHVIVVAFQHLHTERQADLMTPSSPCLHNKYTPVTWIGVEMSLSVCVCVTVYHGLPCVAVPPVVFDAVLSNIGRFPRTDCSSWPRTLPAMR